MSEEECARAIAYGMMAVEPGIDALALGEMGIGNTTVAAALCMGLFGGDAAEWTGPGTGVVGAGARNQARGRRGGGGPAPAGSRRSVRAVAPASAGSNSPRGWGRGRDPGGAPWDGWPVVARWLLGGRRGRRCCSPPTRVRSIIASSGHVSAEPGHRRLLDRIGKPALLDLGMRLGEALRREPWLLGILKAAVACHAGMATFAEAGVSGPVRVADVLRCLVPKPKSGIASRIDGTARFQPSLCHLLLQGIYRRAVLRLPGRFAASAANLQQTRTPVRRIP